MSGNLHNNSSPFRTQYDGREKVNPQGLKASEQRGWFQIAPGYVTLFATNVFSGATLKLQISPNKKDWFELWSVTAPGFIVKDKMASCFGRWVVVGGDGSTNINAFCATTD